MKEQASVVKTIVAIPVALFTWAIVYTISYIIFNLWDSSRGLDNDWLQWLFRELFTPALGGYTAIYVVSKYLKNASLKVASLGLCVPLVGFYVLIPVYIIAFHSADFAFDWVEQIMQWSMALFTCVGAYFSYRSYNET